jgi:hypothetical protein
MRRSLLALLALPALPALAAFAALLLAAPGCSKSPPGNAGTALTEEDELLLAVCGGHQPCSIESQLSLGVAPDGHRRDVVVTRSPKRRPTTERGITGPMVEQPWEDLSAVGGAPSPLRECVPWRTWWVSRSASDGTHARLLVARCAADDGDRAPVLERVGVDGVRVTQTARADILEGRPELGYTEAVESLEFEGTQVPEERAGAAATPTRSASGLAPPRVLRIARRHGHGGPAVSDGDAAWDWEAFRGHACGHGHDDCAEILPVAHIADDGAFGGGAWKTTALGPCALLLDGTPSHGVAEPTTESPTASLRALVADGVLYLEVIDDAFVTHGAVVDAVEVTWSSYEAKPGEHPVVERLTMDGKLTRAGSAEQAEVAEAGPSTRRFALRGVWPPALGSWSLAYVDTDDGRTVRQRIVSVPSGSATGQTVLRIEPEPICTPRDQVLRVEPATAPTTPADEGLVP